MNIRIETDIPHADLKRFLEENDLKVPVFYSKNTSIVVDINPRNRQAALRLIEWLVTR